MKKNLVYYCLGLNPLYLDIFKKSLESLDKSNPEIIDVLVITNKSFHEKYLTDFNRQNLFFLFVDEFKNGDDICFSKLNIFDWEKINNYENIFMSDSDVLFKIDMKQIFEKCKEENRLYAPIEDYSYENHRRIYFSLGNYTDNDIDFFKRNEIHTFNCGTYMFKNCIEMRKHFSNIFRIIKGHKGDYFSDQSFMNYYFNRMKLVDYSVIDCDKNLVYVIEENVNLLSEFNGKIFHFLGNTYYGEDKLEKMKSLYNKMFPQKKIHITSVSDDRRKINFFSNEEMSVTVDVRIGVKTIYKNELYMLPGINYWVALYDGYYNKTVNFYNQNFSQVFDLDGTIKTLLKNVKKIELPKGETELSSYLRGKNSIFYETRKQFFDYYNTNFEFIKYQNFNILELNSSTNTYNSLKNFFTSSHIVGTTFSLKEFENCPDCNMYYFDNRTKKLLDPINKIIGKDAFDVIISSNSDFIVDRDILHNILNYLKIGARLFCEDVKITDFPNIESDVMSSGNKFQIQFVDLINSENETKNLMEILRIS